MSIIWTREEHTFKVTEETNHLIGIYSTQQGEQAKAELMFSTQLESLGQGKVLMPSGMMAQDGKMCHSFKDRSLCQMLNFYASLMAFRDEIEKIFISLNGLSRNDVTFLKSLGGRFHQDFEFLTTTGTTDKISGYIISVSTMNKISATDWFNEGWRLAPFYEQETKSALRFKSS